MHEGVMLQILEAVYYSITVECDDADFVCACLYSDPEAYEELEIGADET